LMFILVDEQNLLQQAKFQKEKDYSITFVVSNSKSKIVGLSKIFSHVRKLNFPGEFTAKFIEEVNEEVCDAFWPKPDSSGSEENVEDMPKLKGLSLKHISDMIDKYDFTCDLKDPILKDT